MMTENMQSETKTAAAESKPSKKYSQGSWLIKFLVLCLLASFVIIIVMFRIELLQSERQLDQIQRHFGNFFNTQKNIQINNEKRFSDLLRSSIQQQDNISWMKTQLSTLLSRTSSTDIQALKIAEIDYLMHMAQVELKIKHNVPAAIVLLKQAENELTQLNVSSKYNQFHVLLLKNIAILEQVPIIETDGILEKLDGLKEDVSNLSILVSPKSDTFIVENTPHQAHKRWYQRAWDNIKASLQKLIIVRHQDDKIPALLSPDAKLYLQENLQLLLMRAQWGLINHDAQIYQKSLQEAQSWVEKYYVQNSAATISFLKTLKPLLNQNVSPAVPDLSPLFSALRGETS